MFVIKWITLLCDGEKGVGIARVLKLKFSAINLTESLMTISKSSELSSAPACQNLDKSPRIHLSDFFFFLLRCDVSASLTTVKVTNAGG